jgi:hypothetical protein
MGWPKPPPFGLGVGRPPSLGLGVVRPPPRAKVFLTLALGGGSATPMGHRDGPATPRPAGLKVAEPPQQFLFLFF